MYYVECKHVGLLHFCISQVVLYIFILPISLYYQNARNAPEIFRTSCSWHSSIALASTRHRPTSSESPASILSSRISVMPNRYSPYSRIFQSEAATALSRNKYFKNEICLVSCRPTNYFMSIHNFRCSVQLMKIAKRDKKSL